MTKHDTAGNLPASYPVPKTITEIEAAYAALSRAGDGDADQYLIEWREAQLRHLCALDLSELSTKLICLADLTGTGGGLTEHGQDIAHRWVTSILRDVYKMIEG
ncbi:hypothetical protein TH24_11095 [Thalassospira xiamenensis]|nr:hypothetical protein TH24_11095 [Thalassospira xiamenensis]